MPDITYSMNSFKLSRYISIKDNMSIEKIPLDKVFIIGNGAIEGGWDAVLEAFKSYDWNNKLLQSNFFANIDNENVLHALTILAFNEKLFRNNYIIGLKNKDESIKVLTEINEFKKHLSSLLDIFIRDGKMKLKNFVYDLIAKEYTDSSYFRYGVITLNWDQTIWNDYNNFPNLIQLHGRSDFPESLVLPTDLTVDNYVIKKLSRDNGIDNQLISLSELDYEVKNSHFAAIHWLNNTREIIFIGIGFNPYDSELNSILFSTDVIDKVIKLYDINKKNIKILSSILSLNSKKIIYFKSKNDVV